MNKLIGKKPDGSEFLALVLEPGNLHRLQQNDPIVVHLADLFPDGIPPRLEVLIDYSETPHADSKQFAAKSEETRDQRTDKMRSRPHCPQCRSTIEQIAYWSSKDSPVALIFCPVCGCTLGCLRHVS